MEFIFSYGGRIESQFLRSGYEQRPGGSKGNSHVASVEERVAQAEGQTSRGKGPQQGTRLLDSQDSSLAGLGGMKVMMVEEEFKEVAGGRAGHAGFEGHGQDFGFYFNGRTSEGFE